MSRWRIAARGTRRRRGFRRRTRSWSSPEAATQSVPVDDRTVAVVMTHNYAQDLELLKWLLPSPVRYLGILGARNRTAAMLRTLRDQTPGLREHHLEKVYSPIGLDIGAETPGRSRSRSWRRSGL